MKGVKFFWFFLLVVTAVVTLFKLGVIPKAFYWDEAALGYYGWSLWKTGADEFGNKWPMYFKSIGDYKYPVYSYLSIIPMAIIGLSTFSARLVAALAGIVSVVVIFKLVIKEKWFENTGWLAMGVLLAISSPWYLLFARTAREATLGMALILGGFWAFYKFLQTSGKRQENWWIGLMAVLFSLAGLTYSAERLFLLLLMSGLLIIYRQEKLKRIKMGVVFGIVGLILAALTLDPGSRLRAQGAVNLIDKTTVITAQEQVFEVGMAIKGQWGIPLARVFDNKVVIKAKEWTFWYLRHFDWSYLFVKANSDLPWYFVVGCGLLPLIGLPLLIFGLLRIGSKWKENKLFQVIIWWLLVSAVAPALTIEVPNPIRQLIAWPAFMWIILLGLTQVIERLEKRSVVFKIGLAVLIIFNAVYGWKQFFIHREYHLPWYTNQNYEQIVDYIGQHQKEYQKIVLPEDPYIFFLFWGTEKYGWKNSDLVTIDKQWGSVTAMQNIEFLASENCPTKGEEGNLYFCLGDKIPQQAESKFMARFKNGDLMGSLIEFRQRIGR